MRFVLSSVLDSGTLSSSSAQGEYENYHIRNEMSRATYRSTGKDNEWLRWHFFGGTAFNTLHFNNYNLSPSALSLWQGALTSSFTGTAYRTELGVPTDSYGHALKKYTGNPVESITTISEMGTDVLPAGRSEHGCLVFADKIWILGGNRGGGRREIQSSPDGVDWFLSGTRLAKDTRWPGAVVYNGKMWLIGGATSAIWTSAFRGVYSSSDGITWTEQGTDALPQALSQVVSVVFNNKMWVIGGRQTDNNGSRKVYSSSDGITWTEAGTDALPTGLKLHTGVVYDEKMWVFGGLTGVGSFSARVYSSSDGATWTEQGTDSLPGNIYNAGAAVLNNKMYLIGGTGQDTIYESIDGITWTEVGSNIIPFFLRNMGTVVWYNKIFLVGGSYWTGSQYTETVKVWYFTNKPEPYYPFFRWYIEDPSNSNDYLQLGRCMGGNYTAIDRELSDGFKLRRSDPSIGSGKGGMIGRWGQRTQYDTLDFRYKYLPQNQSDTMRSFFADVGNNRPFLLSLFPDTRPHHNSYYGQLKTPMKRQHIIQQVFDLPDLVFEEKI
jgi:hypothetical protein